MALPRSPPSATLQAHLLLLAAWAGALPDGMGWGVLHRPLPGLVVVLGLKQAVEKTGRQGGRLHTWHRLTARLQRGDTDTAACQARGAYEGAFYLLRLPSDSSFCKEGPQLLPPCVKGLQLKPMYKWDTSAQAKRRSTLHPYLVSIRPLYSKSPWRASRQAAALKWCHFMCQRLCVP